MRTQTMLRLLEERGAPDANPFEVRLDRMRLGLNQSIGDYFRGCQRLTYWQRELVDTYRMYSIGTFLEHKASGAIPPGDSRTLAEIERVPANDLAVFYLIMESSSRQ